MLPHTYYRFSRFIFLPLFIFTLFACFATTPAQAQQSVQAAHSGTYLTPGRDGEGWLVEVLNDTTALIIWFTFTPQDSDTGIQAWFGGIGRIEDDRIIVDNANITSGARFGDMFNPDDVVRTPWGSFEFAFEDQNGGTMMFAGLPAYGDGVRPFRRVSGIVGLPFGVPANQLPQPMPGQPGVSGTWVDFSHDGEGWFLQEVAPGVLVMAWFTFNDVGQQVWLIATGNLNGNVALFDNVRIADGTDFGSAFDQDTVNRRDWGEIRIVFTDCNNAVLTYQSSLTEFGSGQLRPVRLSSLQNLNCEFAPLGDLNQLTSSRVNNDNGPALTESAIARLGDAFYVAGGFRQFFPDVNEFWRYQPLTNTWTQLADLPDPRDNGIAVGFDGKFYHFGGMATSTISAFRRDDTWEYDPVTNQWRVLTPMPGERSDGGAIVIGEHIYVAGGNISNTIFQYSPAEDQWEVIPIVDGFVREDAAVVAYQGEIWIIGGGIFSQTNTVTIFDPVTRTTRPGPSTNLERAKGVSAVIGGQLILAVGADTVFPETILNFTEVYDPETDSWQLITAPLVQGVANAGGLVFEDRLFVLLGNASGQLGRANILNTVQVLEFSQP